ncbi:hypothetical protein HK101_004086 [Irineochytrium annulatum]|nr:hypothetical protein HK101_004086 [Irineochytrium annulatum]
MSSPAPATRSFSSIVKRFASSEAGPVSFTIAAERKPGNRAGNSKAENQRVLRETKSTMRRAQASRDPCAPPSLLSLYSGPLTPTSTRKTSVAVAIKVEESSGAMESMTLVDMTPIRLEMAAGEEAAVLRQPPRKRKDVDVMALEDDASCKAEDPDAKVFKIPKPLTKKRNRTKSYAPPEMYAHLNPIPDCLDKGLLVMIVGTNPGVKTALTGHAPTSQAGELSHEEQVAATAVLEAKVALYKPEVVFLVGKSIWEKIFCYRHGRQLKKEEFKLGWQDERLGLADVKRFDEHDVAASVADKARFFRR